MLVNLAKAALESASWPTEIMTGRYMFELGDNVRNVADQPTKFNGQYGLNAGCHGEAKIVR